MKGKIISTFILGFIILCACIYSVYINWPLREDEQIEVSMNNVNFAKEEEGISVGETDTKMHAHDEAIEVDHQHEEETAIHEHTHEGEERVHLEGEIVHDHNHSGHEHEVNETEVLDSNVLAKDFELKTLDGNTVKLSDYKGKKVVLNFWATWCPPCREEMPTFQKYHEELAEQNNVAILAVNITDQDLGMDKIREFVDQYELTFPILLDETGEISKNYEILTIPATFIIDESGQVNEQVNGPLTSEMLQQLLDK